MRGRSACSIALAALAAAVVSATPARPYGISGTIEIEGAADFQGITVWADSSRRTATGPAGGYVLEGLDDGTYTIKAWRAGCLAKVIASVTISGSDEVRVDGVLSPGDFNFDEVIDLIDAGMLRPHYSSSSGEQGWDPAFDIHADGTVDDLDLRLLTSHWKEESEARVPVFRDLLRITKPGYDHRWFAGQRGAAVLWDSNLGGEVRISLRERVLGEVAEIASSTPNDGNFIDYDFIVDPGLTPGKYFVRVSYDEKYYDDSPEFDILAPPAEPELGWKEASPGWTLRAVSLAGPQTATTAGEAGTILRTADGGATWEEQESGTWRTLLGVSFAGPEAGTAVGEDGMVLTTANGGADWVQRFPGLGNTFHSVFQIDSRTAVAAGERGIAVLTEDGGDSWTTLPTGTASDLMSIDCTDPSGWIAAGDSGTVISSFDGGSTWVARESGVSMTIFDVCSNGAGRYTAVSFECFEFYCRPVVLRSADGGASWSAAPAGYHLYGNGLAFVDEDRGFMACSNADAYGATVSLLGTVDGGASWTRNGTISGDMFSIDFSGGTGMASGRNEAVIVSDDAGETWLHTAGQPFELAGVDHLAPGIAVAAGFWRDPGSLPGGVVIRTSNGGADWRQLPVTSEAELYCVSFAGPDTGLVAGAGGTVLVTFDGGDSWDSPASGVSAPLYDAEHFGGALATAVGEGVILQTADGGATWTPRDPGADVRLRGVAYGSAEDIWVAGYDGTILRSTDGGASWTSQETGTSHLLFDVDFNGPEKGIAVALHGTILRTVDGGSSWTVVTGVPDRTLVSVEWTGPLSVVAVGMEGTVLRSTDGGRTWSVQQTPTGEELRGVSFHGDLDGIVVGYGGTILHTSTAGE